MEASFGLWSQQNEKKIDQESKAKQGSKSDEKQSELAKQLIPCLFRSFSAFQRPFSNHGTTWLQNGVYIFIHGFCSTTSAAHTCFGSFRK
jgi:hypothetical protein